MEIFDVHRENRLLDLIEQGALEHALELLKGDNHISHDELNKSLISACQRGYKYIVQMLVQRGANVNYRDTNGNTPLLISVQRDVTGIVKILLTNRADANACNCVDDSALILSINSSGSTEITESLLKQTGINIDHQNQDGYTAIMKAAEVKDVNTLIILLDKYFTTSASPIDEHKRHEHISTLTETVNCKGENVHQIAERCGIGSVFQLLLEHESTKISHLELAMRANDIQSFHIFLDCNFIYAKKKTRYLRGVFEKCFQTCSIDGIVHFNENKIAMIKSLLEHEVDVNTTWFYNIPLFDRKQAGRDRFYFAGQVCAIQIAAKSGCFKVLELLLSFKANVTRHDFRSSPLHIALCHGHTECAKLLIQHGANIDFNHVLELAVGRQEPKYVRFLIENYKNELMEHLKRTSQIQDILIRSVRLGNLEIIGQILDLGADINDVKRGDRSPLAESKNGKVAKFLIDRGANVKHAKQTGCDPPLIKVLIYMESAHDCVIEVIKVLLENGASVNDRSWNGKTPLMLAAKKEGSMSVMQLLLDHGAELCERDREGNTALILAIRAGCFQNVSFLFQFIKDRKELLNVLNDENGAFVNDRFWNGKTLLMLEAVKEGNMSGMQLLLDHGAELSERDGEGNTALTHAVMAGCFQNVSFLFQFIKDRKELLNIQNDENGASVNDRFWNGKTLLMLAAVKEGNMSVMQLLLDLGAELSERDGDGNTALTHAVMAGCFQNVSFLFQFIKDGKELLNIQNDENGASVNDRFWNGKTLLMLAAVKEGNMSVMQLLLDHGAELSERDRKGNTALIHAVRAGCVNNVSFLLQFIKDRKELLNIQNDEGFTAFMCAMRVSNSTIIKELIEAGCDVNSQYNNGLSPLMLAAQYCSKDAMCVLLDSGAEINAVSKEDNTKTALTHLRYIRRMHHNYFSCLEYLLDRGASSSYLAATTLHNMIIVSDLRFIPKLIRCGLRPVCVLLNDILVFSHYSNMNTRSVSSLAYEVGNLFDCSPLCIALCIGNSALARFFVGTLFLTHSDVFLLGHNEQIRHHLASWGHTQCLDILTEITAQPMTLFNLSFLAVSTAVGATPGREIRVNKLEVPQIIKDKLLFKGQDIYLTVPKKKI